MIRDFIPGMETALSEMIQKIFDKYIGFEYTDEGKKTFRDFIQPSEIIERYAKGNILLLSLVNERITGVVEIRDNTHICLFFVDPDFHRKGIGRELMNEAIKRVIGKTDHLTVNSSIYAKPIYERLGFVQTDELRERDGIKYISMKMCIKKNKSKGVLGE